MHLIIVSSTSKSKSEIPSVIKLFEAGLQTFHVRKPKFSRKQLKEYIKLIPKEYRNRIVIHNHFGLASKYRLKGIHFSRKNRDLGAAQKFRIWWLKKKKSDLQLSASFSSISSFQLDQRSFEYVFLNQVFDEQSDNGLNGIHTEKQLRSFLNSSRTPVIAFGGLEDNSILFAKRLGFHGVALMSNIWKSNKTAANQFLSVQGMLKEQEPILVQMKSKTGA